MIFIVDNILAWVGGKCALSDQITKWFPRHRVYVDVFGGGGNMFLNKPPSPVEVYNDINDRLVNFWRVLQTDAHQLYLKSLSEGWLASRKIGNECLTPSADPLEDAFRFFYLNRHSFCGKTDAFSSRNDVEKYGCDHHLSYLNKLNQFKRFSQRLKHVLIEMQDFETIIKRFDDRDVFFYCDPPYVQGGEMYEDVVGGKSWTLVDFDRLVQILKTIKGKAMVSYDRRDWADAIGWQTEEITRTNRMNRTKDHHCNQKTEYISMNYQIQSRL